jgi:archaellum component FlaC
MVGWAVGAAAMLLLQGLGVLRTSLLIRRARPVQNQRWLRLADETRELVGCRRSVRLVLSRELDTPAVFGCIHPVVILPASSHTWLEDRLEAVLQHEFIHITRLDWPARIIGRAARAVYWFNPLAWWAVHRLDLEQELACDEEVLSLGTRASSYACHLLGVARSAARCPSAAVAGLEMARRSHLEERIMSMLHRRRHRKIGLTVMLPAVLLTAALVPAIAAVQPAEREPRTAGPELREALTEMRRAEERIDPSVARIEAIEIDMEPVLETIDDLEVDIDHEALARIEAEMEPILARIEAIEIDMGPVHEQIEAMHEQLESMTFHIEDGTLDEVHRQIEEQMEVFHQQMESMQFDLEPYHEQIEQLHEQLEPLHEQMAQLHVDALPHHDELERIHEDALARMHDEIDRIHDEMAPLHEELERLGHRIERAVSTEVAGFLRSQLAAVATADAPFGRAADLLVDEADIHVEDDLLTVAVPRRDSRRILTDLFEPHMIGSRDVFERAVEAAAGELGELEFSVE